MGDGSNDNLTVGQLRRLTRMLNVVVDATMPHAMVILSDGVGNHECEPIDLSEEELRDQSDDFEPEDVEAYLALEHAVLATLKVARVTMRAQGYPLEEAVPVFE